MSDDVVALVHRALAGAVLLRDHCAGSGDAGGGVLALHTVDALNDLALRLGLPSPAGTAAMVVEDDRAVPGFVDPA